MSNILLQLHQKKNSTETKLKCLLLTLNIITFMPKIVLYFFSQKAPSAFPFTRYLSNILCCSG